MPYPIWEFHPSPLSEGTLIMRVMMRTGPLVLALGFALAGCDEARNGASPASEPAALPPSESDYVLTVEGMH
jgi:hypothetical protein